MAIIAAVILAVLVVGPFLLAITPSRHRDPQDGMAVGFLMMFSFTMLIPAALLAWAHFARHPIVVKIIFWTLAALACYVAIAGTTMTIIRSRKLRHMAAPVTKRAD